VANSAGKSGGHTLARALNTRWSNICQGATLGRRGLTGASRLGRGGRGLADSLQRRLYGYYDHFARRKGYRVRFYDGVLPGPPQRVLEIKGPTDSFNTKHGPGQAQDLASLTPATAAVTCEACDSPHCEMTPSGGQKCS
jgi:hypothetical protein